MTRAIDVLVPTIDRPESLLICLSSIAGQTYPRLNVIVSEQSRNTIEGSREAAALRRIIEARGGSLRWYHRHPSLGIAEQRQFLLSASSSDTVLFIDDDVYMEPQVVAELAAALEAHGCAFVGAFPAGLSFRNDVRLDQQRLEFWDGKVTPESLDVGSPEWSRADLHRAANLWHAVQRLHLRHTRVYKIAWVACCILYDRRKLEAVGGFSFWPKLPRYHSGEEVVVQNILMRRWGGCAIAPSGTYHIELPSTVLNGKGSVDGHALDLLPELIEKFAPRLPEGNTSQRSL